MTAPFFPRGETAGDYRRHFFPNDVGENLRGQVNSELKKLEEAIDEIAELGWICPVPIRWNEMYELLPRKDCTGALHEPPQPLILGAWWEASPLTKKQRFLEQLEWARSHATLDSVMIHLTKAEKERLVLRLMNHSSNLARKKRRLEGKRETGGTVAEETKTAKPLMIQDFPITLQDFS